MTDQQEPERIWYSGGLYHARHLRRVPPESDAHPQIEYAHHDLLEAAEKRIAHLEEWTANMEEWTANAIPMLEKAEAERDQALASVGAVIEKAAETYEDGFPEWDTFSSAASAIRTINPDATAALNEMLADAWDDGNCAPLDRDNPFRKDVRK